MKLKICGLTNAAEAQYLNEAKADFAGFILFYPKSKRNISLAQAASISEKLNSEIKRVAVVVSPTAEQVNQIQAARAGFDYLQVHGTLGKEAFDTIRLPILRAFNVSDMDKYPAWRSCDKVAGYVFDAAEPGSGKTFDWSLVTALPQDEKLFLLAGGLNARNVAEAIRVCKPDGVDVSSGVEYDGRLGKDPAKIKEFAKILKNF